MLALFLGATSTSRDDYPYLIAQIAQDEGFAMPAPFIVADTNWVTDYFGFVVNPGNCRFELWRVDYTGSGGAPMADWAQWLNGSRRDLTWGVYINPYDYSL